MGDREGAIESFLQAYELIPEWISPLESLTRLYHNDDEYEKAIKYGLKACSIDPDSELLNEYIGVSYMMLHKYKPAIEHCKKEIEGYGPNETTLFHIAESYFSNGINIMRFQLFLSVAIWSVYLLIH